MGSSTSGLVTVGASKSILFTEGIPEIKIKDSVYIFMIIRPMP